MQLRPAVVVPIPLVEVLVLLICAVIVIGVCIHRPPFAAALQAAGPFIAAVLAVLLTAWGLVG